MSDDQTPEVTLHDRTMTADMAEISGFGGSYEEGCRLMVLAGVAWLADHIEAEPIVGYYEGITGIDHNCNDDADQLEAAMLAAPYDDNGTATTVGAYGATGAMVQYAKLHILRVHRVGWEQYCADSRARR